MRQKVMLGAAFIHEPALLFLDEPFINLDPLFQRKVQGYLRGYIAGGGTIFMCSHLLEIAERLCSRLTIINEGMVVASGTLDELMGEGEEDLGEVFMRLVGRKVEELEREAPEAGAVKGV
jgi:ABC-2 type transport system ATP-binding protein